MKIPGIDEMEHIPLPEILNKQIRRDNFWGWAWVAVLYAVIALLIII